MKKYIVFALTLLASLQSCKKDGPTFTPLASLNVADAVIGGRNVKLNTNVRDSATLYSYKLFQIVAGESPIKLYPTNNPAAPYFDQTRTTVNGGIYSMFLTGTASAPENVFVKDEIPPFSQDSIVRVRIVNCSVNSSAISVTLGSAPTATIFSNIAYKSVSAFRDIELKTRLAVGGNIFQVRDSSGTLLASYTLPATGLVSVASSRFKNITLVVRGLAGTTGGTDAFGIYGMTNY
ncbi:MAG: hypothetical protein EOO85_12935 [Pedobacter sp.]|nr:MAG: hypothetical protein EOO85_12935 [Pedobacter sp.]